MAQWIIIIRNESGSDQIIEDLGFPVIDSTADINLHEQFTYDEISGSDDLRELVNNGNIIINDGLKDLTPLQGVKYLTIINKQYLEKNYYDKDYLDNQLINKNTLDEAYNEGGGGAGRFIDATAGSVVIDIKESTNAPIELTEKSILPTTDLSAGQLAVKDGILFVYDGSRSKWLSTTRTFIVFGRKGKTKDQYLNIYSGYIPSNLSGMILSKNATIVSMAGVFELSSTGTFEIRKNDDPSTITSLSLNSQIKKLENSTDVDLDAGDVIQGYFSSDTRCKTPVIVLEVAWR